MVLVLIAVVPLIDRVVKPVTVSCCSVTQHRVSGDSQRFGIAHQHLLCGHRAGRQSRIHTQGHRITEGLRARGAHPAGVQQCVAACIGRQAAEFFANGAATNCTSQRRGCRCRVIARLRIVPSDWTVLPKVIGHTAQGGVGTQGHRIAKGLRARGAHGACVQPRGAACVSRQTAESFAIGTATDRTGQCGGAAVVDRQAAVRAVRTGRCHPERSPHR